jgi:sulfoxide reductase heme-binding subunit YedZ
MKLPWLKPGVLIGALVPLARLVVDASRGTLGADPIAIALNRRGLLALILLWASLAATPLKILFGVTWPIRIRQLLGLLAFFYASLHFLLYAVVDQGLDFVAIVEDVTDRRFITVGFLALVLLIPLAVTSPAAMLKRLGAARWKRLHRLAYVVAVLVTIHFAWRVKKDFSQPIAYGAVLAVLLGMRLLPARLLPPRTRKPPSTQPLP